MTRIKEKGFSLIELLLGLAIFSAVTACIYGTFWGGIALSRRSQKEGVVDQQIRLAVDLISKDLENMVFYDFAASYPEASSFDGRRDVLTLLSASAGGLKFIRYYLDFPDRARVHKVVIGGTSSRNTAVVIRREENERAKFFMREEWDFADYLNDAGPQNGATEVIARDLTEDGLRFFFGYWEDEDKGTYRWENEWGQTFLPRAVRVEMDFLAPDSPPGTRTIGKNIFIPQGTWGKTSEGS